MWGKLSEDQRKNKNIFLNNTEYAKFNKILLDKDKELLSFNILSDNLLALTYRSSERTTEMSNRTNEITASYVSAYGRLKLHEILVACEKSKTTRCLYYVR